MVLLESDDVVADLHIGDALAHGLDDTSTLMSQDDGERALRVLARECVRVWTCSATLLRWATRLTCVADAGVVDLDTDLIRLWRCDLDVLDAQLLASLPGHGGLASDGLHGWARQYHAMRGVGGVAVVTHLSYRLGHVEAVTRDVFTVMMLCDKQTGV